MFFGLLILCLFACVLMHEYGHALMARRFGVGTRDIILSPIGGVARLEEMPRKPVQELLIAIAGPLVNVVIALILLILLSIISDSGFIPLGEDLSLIDVPIEFIKILMFTNAALFVFNLVPAFPMDGGRILRAFLAFFVKWPTATKVASIIGRLLAIGFVIIGFWQGAYTLMLIGVFIYFMASREWQAVHKEEFISNTSIGEIKDDLSIKLNVFHSVEEIIELSSQHNRKTLSIAEDSGKLVGFVIIDEVMQWKKHNPGLTANALDFIHHGIGRVDADATILETFQYMRRNQLSVCEIYQDHRRVGVIDRAKISKYL